MTKWPESSAEWSVDKCHDISMEQLKVYEFKFNAQQQGRPLTFKLGTLFTVKWDDLQSFITFLN